MTTATPPELRFVKTMVWLGVVAWLLILLLVGAVYLTARDTQNASDVTRNAIVINRGLIRENNRLIKAHVAEETERVTCSDRVQSNLEVEWRKAVNTVLEHYVRGDVAGAVQALPMLDVAANIDIAKAITDECG